jgi:hypothetical protein
MRPSFGAHRRFFRGTCRFTQTRRIAAQIGTGAGWTSCFDGVRQGEKPWLTMIQQALDDSREEIVRILREYHVRW